MITKSQYFRAYIGHPSITDEYEANAEQLLERVNRLLVIAAADGWVATVNESTGNLISGQDNGGWRPPECPIGAKGSKHKTAEGIDIADPVGMLDKWLMTESGLQALEQCMLWLEHPGWTDGWSHLQSVPPGNPPRPEYRVYIPSSARPQTTIYGESPVIRRYG